MTNSVYVLETKLPAEKSLLFALTKVYGIGYSTALTICKKLGFSQNFKVKDLNPKQILEITKLTDALKVVINNNLKKTKSLAIKRLITIKSYRGSRISKGFPARGQRTHSNANSSKKQPRF